MPPSRDPAELSTADRTRELARLLAAGLRRLRHPTSAASPAVPSTPQKVLEFRANELASPPEQSVTGHAG